MASGSSLDFSVTLEAFSVDFYFFSLDLEFSFGLSYFGSFDLLSLDFSLDSGFASLGFGYSTSTLESFDGLGSFDFDFLGFSGSISFLASGLTSGSFGISTAAYCFGDSSFISASGSSYFFK